MDRTPSQQQNLRRQAIETAASFSIYTTSQQALREYQSIIERGPVDRSEDYFTWINPVELVASEWKIIKNTLDAASHALRAT